MNLIVNLIVSLCERLRAGSSVPLGCMGKAPGSGIQAELQVEQQNRRRQTRLDRRHRAELDCRPVEHLDGVWSASVVDQRSQRVYTNPCAEARTKTAPASLLHIPRGGQGVCSHVQSCTDYGRCRCAGLRNTEMHLGWRPPPPASVTRNAACSDVQPRALHGCAADPWAPVGSSTSPMLTSDEGVPWIEQSMQMQLLHLSTAGSLIVQPDSTW